ncbi:GNAT family N-acetyltransferase [Chitinimonas arctica]|nr:GNAT family N-acetyltransferase [Chitinimonas arctica]
MDRPRAEAVNVAFASKRLILEPIGAHHAPLMFSAMQDPAIYQWISSEPPETEAEQAAGWGRLVERLRNAKDERCFVWAAQRVSDGAWLGTLDVVAKGEIASNVGYVFFPPFWGQGYASEAVAALSDHLARQGIVEQRAAVTVGNIASTRVLERAGFLAGRVMVGNDTIRGCAVDDIEYIRRD